MTDTPEPDAPKAEPKGDTTTSHARGTARWAAAAGIGSAALVAALLYANRKPTKPPKP